MERKCKLATIVDQVTKAPMADAILKPNNEYPMEIASETLLFDLDFTW